MLKSGFVALGFHGGNGVESGIVTEIVISSTDSIVSG